MHVRDRNLYVPVDSSFTVNATVKGQNVVLTWRGPATGGVRPTYLVFRGPTVGDFPKDGLLCDTSPVPTCLIAMAELGYHRSSYVDRPGPGPWVYRVAQAADYTGAEGVGDPLVFSTPVRVRVPAS